MDQLLWERHVGNDYNGIINAIILHTLTFRLLTLYVYIYSTYFFPLEQDKGNNRGCFYNYFK